MGKPQLGEEMDLLQRAALEISRQGELEITVPSLSKVKYEPARPIPKTSPSEIIRRYEKISQAFDSLTNVRDYGSEMASAYENAADGEQLPGELFNKTPSTFFLQVKVKFMLMCDTTNLAGIVFRRQAPFAKDLYEHLAGRGSNVTLPDKASVKGGPSKAPKAVKAVYTVNNSTGSLYDVDGVRCWLPCLDFTDQRTIFDISISISRSYHVACAGKKLAAVKNATRPKAGRLVHRFFTAHRMPVMQLGFFAGKIESYRMPMYQAKSRVWVLKGIQDIIVRNDHIAEEHHLEPPNTSSTASGTTGSTSAIGGSGEISSAPGSGSKTAVPGGDLRIKRALESYVSRDLKAQSDASIPSGSTTPGPVSNVPESATKRSRVDSFGNYRPSVGTFAAPEASLSATKAQIALDARRLAAEEEKRLYFDCVHHTMLTFDVAVRLLHKFTGHKLHIDEVVVVFVPDLGPSFMAFDGLILVDAKHLNEIHQIYKEFPAHVVLLEAYLYSWLKTCVPIAWFGVEFAVHGIVGYLLHFYTEEVFGEEEGHCHLQRLKDGVVSLEKAGYGQPLMSLYPEGTHLHSRAYGQYMRLKASLLFCMIEHKIGGKDAMRLALKALIKSPLLFHETKLKTAPRQFTSNSAESTPVLSPTLHSPLTELSPVISREASDGNASVVSASGSLSTPGAGASSTYVSALDETPYHPSSQTYNAGELSPYVSNDRLVRGSGYRAYGQSESNLGALSPRSPFRLRGSSQQSQRGMLSPLSPRSPGTFFGGGHHSSNHSSQLSPTGSLSPPGFGLLSRQSSLTSNVGWDISAADVMQSECLTAEGFITLMSRVSDSCNEFSEGLIERFVCRRGIGLYNVKVKYDEAKKIVVRTEQIGYDRLGNLNREYCESDKVTMIFVEDCDDFVSKMDVSFEKKPLSHEKSAYTRPGRRKERVANNRDRNLRSALELVRSTEVAYPVKYAVIDPMDTFFSDVLWLSNDSQLVEMLHGDYKELGPQMAQYKTLIRTQAVRSLARSNAHGEAKISATMASSSTAVTGGNTGAASASNAVGVVRLAEKSVEVEVLALYEVVMNGTKDGKVFDFPLALRIDAIYGLAQWQNHHAPAMIVEPSRNGTDTEATNNWPGMEALIQCLFELCTDPDTMQVLPLHLHDETACALRYALLLALGSVRSQRGFTPPEVVDTLLLFAEYLSEDYAQQQREYAEELQRSQQLQQQQQAAQNKMDVEGDEDPTSSAAANKENNSTNNTALSPAASLEHQFDDSEYRAVLYLALSRVRFHRIYLDDPQQPIYQILELAKSAIQRNFGEAKVDARIAFDRFFQLQQSSASSSAGTPQMLPRLKNEGVEVAAALTCLSEMDVQTTLAFPRERAKASRAMETANILPKASRTMPLPFGLVSHMSYLRCFVPPQRLMYCVDREKERNEPISFSMMTSLASNGESQNGHSVHSNSASAVSGSLSASETAALEAKEQEAKRHRTFLQHYDFFLCSPLVRATAYECFARNCLAMHVACSEASRTERSLQSPGHTSQTSAGSEQPALYFSAAIVEALEAVQTGDTSSFVKLETAQAFQHLVLERPASIVLSHLTQGRVLHPLGLADPLALTHQARSDFAPSSQGADQHNGSLSLLPESQNSAAIGAMRVTGKAMVPATSTWQKVIARTTGFHQPVRELLLRSWLACFGGHRRPPVMAASASRHQEDGMTPLLAKLHEVFPKGSRDALNLVVRVSRHLDEVTTPFRTSTLAVMIFRAIL